MFEGQVINRKKPIEMHLIQLTDTHVGLEGQDTMGVDVRRNFRQALEQIGRLRPELLVLTGDLCFDQGEITIYQWIKRELDKLDIPYALIAGNHDDPTMMAKVFNRSVSEQTGELFFHKKIGGWNSLFLDTAPGTMSAHQFDWMQDRLASLEGPLLIFMHHPPCLAGVPHMDRLYAFQPRERFWQLLKGYPWPIELFCGHYHVEKTIRMQQVSVHITPSLYLQIDMHREDFGVDHYRPAFREIWLEEDRLMTSVSYLDS